MKPAPSKMLGPPCARVSNRIDERPGPTRHSSHREVAPHVIVEISRSPEVSERLRGVFVAGERKQIEAILARVVRRGELPRLSNVATVHRLLGGALFFTIFVIDETIDDAELANVVDVLTTALCGAATSVVDRL